MGDETRDNILKDKNRVRLLIDSLSKLDQKIVHELWFDYYSQLVITNGGLVR